MGMNRLRIAYFFKIIAGMLYGFSALMLISHLTLASVSTCVLGMLIHDTAITLEEGRG